MSSNNPHDRHGNKLEILFSLQRAICELEARYPPEEARERSRRFIATLPATEWSVLEDLVNVVMSPEGMTLMGWTEASVTHVNQLFQSAKVAREAAAKEGQPSAPSPDCPKQEEKG